MSGVGLGHIVKLGSGPWSPSFKICKLYEKGLELMLLLKYTHPHCSGLNFSFPLPNIGQIVFFHAKNKMDFLPQNNTFVQYPKIYSYLKYWEINVLGKIPKGISLHFSDLIFEKQLLAIVQKRSFSVDNEGLLSMLQNKQNAYLSSVLQI